jgi:hypothetical protein
MNMLVRSSRVSLAIFIVAIVVQLVGLVPGLEYMSGAFPTHFHRTESAILLFGLFSSLVMASFFYGRSRYAALVIIGALMFYSGYKAITTIIGVEPLHVRIVWTGVSFVMSGTLAWIVFGAYRLGVFDWRGLIVSFVIASIGIVYLFSM